MELLWEAACVLAFPECQIDKLNRAYPSPSKHLSQSNVATANYIYQSVTQCAAIKHLDAVRRFIALGKPANKMNTKNLHPKAEYFPRPGS